VRSHPRHLTSEKKSGRDHLTRSFSDCLVAGKRDAWTQPTPEGGAAASDTSPEEAADLSAVLGSSINLQKIIGLGSRVTKPDQPLDEIV
jgi:hypothetical protein